MLANRRPTNDEARRQWRRRLIPRQQSGNVTVAEVCHQLGVSPVTFYSWKRRLRETTPGALRAISGQRTSRHPTRSSTIGADFVPVTIRETDLAARARGVVPHRAWPGGALTVRPPIHAFSSAGDEKGLYPEESRESRASESPQHGEPAFEFLNGRRMVRLEGQHRNLTRLQLVFGGKLRDSLNVGLGQVSPDLRPAAGRPTPSPSHHDRQRRAADRRG
jgi:hypothetical protein